MQCYSLFPVLTLLQFLPAYGHSPVPSESCAVFVFCPEFIMVFHRRISSIQATPLLLETANILRFQKSFKYSKDILGHVTTGKIWITILQITYSQLSLLLHKLVHVVYQVRIQQPKLYQHYFYFCHIQQLHFTLSYVNMINDHIPRNITMYFAVSSTRVLFCFSFKKQKPTPINFNRKETLCTRIR